jgi:hypothetical protein
MRRLDCELKVLLGAAILRASNHRKVVIEGDLSPHEGVNLLRDLKGLLRSFH